MADRKTGETELTPRAVIALFEKVVKDNPRDARAHLDLASAYYAAHDLDAAFTELEQAIALSPGLDHAHYYLGVIYAKRGDTAKARAEWEKVIGGGAHFMLKNQASMQLATLGAK
jgi:tetratricopeptide (TPR) repeat protein